MSGIAIGGITQPAPKVVYRTVGVVTPAYTTVGFTIGDEILVTAGGSNTNPVLETWILDSNGLWKRTNAPVVEVEDEVNVSGVTFPITFPTATLPGTPVFLPNTPADVTKLYSIVTGTNVAYAKWNGTQYISSTGPSGPNVRSGTTAPAIIVGTDKENDTYRRLDSANNLMETYIVDNGVRVTQRSHVTHSADGLRTVNQNPIAYEAGTTNEFKDTATINMGAILPGVGLYANVVSSRPFGPDLTGGPVRQTATLADGRTYYRLSTGPTTRGPWQTVATQINDLVETGAVLQNVDTFPMLDISDGVLANQKSFMSRIDRFVNSPINFINLSDAPGGVFPQSIMTNGILEPSDGGQMFNGSHLPTFTLPVPVYDGQEFLFRNLATTATTGNILNTNMRAPTLVEPNAGAFFRAVSTSVGLRWMLLSERSKIPAFATAPTITFQGFSTPAAAPIAMTYYESDPTSITYVMNQNVTIANTGGVWKNYAPTNVAGYKASIYTQTMYRTSNYAGRPVAPAMDRDCSDNFNNSLVSYAYDLNAPGNIVNVLFTIFVTYKLI